MPVGVGGVASVPVILVRDMWPLCLSLSEDVVVLPVSVKKGVEVTVPVILTEGGVVPVPVRKGDVYACQEVWPLCLLVRLKEEWRLCLLVSGTVPWPLCLS